MNREELIARLRRNSGWRNERHECVIDPALLMEAADALESRPAPTEERDETEWARLLYRADFDGQSKMTKPNWPNPDTWEVHGAMAEPYRRMARAVIATETQPVAGGEQIEWPSDGTCRQCGSCPRSPTTGLCATCEDCNEAPDRDPDYRVVRPKPTTPERAKAMEEAARVAEEHAAGCGQARGNAGAMNDRHTMWQAEAERLASLSIAAAIRALSASPIEVEQQQP
jgi:hypothetical protein